MIDWISLLCAKTVARTQTDSRGKCHRNMSSEPAIMVVNLCINSHIVMDKSSLENKEEGALPDEANAE